jgi:hypothetical protein
MRRKTSVLSTNKAKLRKGGGGRIFMAICKGSSGNVCIETTHTDRGTFFSLGREMSLSAVRVWLYMSSHLIIISFSHTHNHTHTHTHTALQASTKTYIYTHPYRHTHTHKDGKSQKDPQICRDEETNLTQGPSFVSTVCVYVCVCVCVYQRLGGRGVCYVYIYIYIYIYLCEYRPVDTDSTCVCMSECLCLCGCVDVCLPDCPRRASLSFLLLIHTL